MSTIITTATIMAMYLNAAGSANSQYAYNADIENGQVSTMYVMNKSGKSLSGKTEIQLHLRRRRTTDSKDGKPLQQSDGQVCAGLPPRLQLYGRRICR